MVTKKLWGVLLAGTLLTAGCSSDESGSDEGVGGSSPGLGSGGGSASAGTGGNTSDGNTSGGNTSGGTTGIAPCSDIGDVLPENVTELFRTLHTGGLLGNFQLLGFKDNAVYVADETEVKRVPIDGSAIEVINTFTESEMPSMVRGDYYLYQTSSATAGMVELSAAPMTDPTNRVLVTTLPSGYYLTYATDAVYYETRDVQSIWVAPYDGSGAVELVPGGSPLGLVEHEGYLYWTDFDTSWLTRVPVTGGTPEPLAEAFFGGPMAGDGSTIYYSDTSANALIRYTLGQTRVETLFNGDTFDAPEELTAQAGSVYFFVGTFCKQLYAASAPDQAQLLVNGFASGYWLQATPSGIVVADDNAVYRVALP